MTKHLKLIPLYLLLAAAAVFLTVWSASLIRCEVLTAKYREDFAAAWQENSMLADVKYCKVLHCDGASTEVYYVSEYTGDVLTFEKQEDGWVQTGWRTVWSKTGSASDAVWPYWWQVFITGV